MGLHQKDYLPNKIFFFISKNSRVKSYPAANIDYFLSKCQAFKDFKTIELYTHPNYKDGVLLDDSISYLHHERQPMQKQIEMLREKENIDFFAWEDGF